MAPRTRPAPQQHPVPGLLSFRYAPAVALSLRRTGLSSPAFADQEDYIVIEDGQVIGRIYEMLYVPADVRWFWSVTEHVDPAHGIVTHGRVPSLQAS